MNTINFDSNLLKETFIKQYLETKGFDTSKELNTLKYKEKKRVYYNELSKKMMLIEDYDSKEGSLGKQICKEINNLYEIKEVENIEYLILVKSVQQKYRLPYDILFQKELDSTKEEIIQKINDLMLQTNPELGEKLSIKKMIINYSFVPDAEKTVELGIEIKDRYTATRAVTLKQSGTEGIVFTASLFDIVKLYDKIGDALFRGNLRIGLDKKNDQLDVTNEITETLQYNPEQFWFLNNGITMIAEKSVLDLTRNHQLKLKDLYDTEKAQWKISVINGAQTITAASKFFLDDNVSREKAFFKRLLGDSSLENTSTENSSQENGITKFLDEFLKNASQSSKMLSDSLKKELIKEIKSSSKNFDFKHFLNAFFKDDKGIDESQKNVLLSLQTNIKNIEVAKKTANVLLRVIYHNNTNTEKERTKATEINNKITVALNRQKPMRMQDIAFISLFAKNINDYAALQHDNSISEKEYDPTKDNTFTIIRRGEMESQDFKKYSLENVMRVLEIIRSKNPGSLASRSIAKRLENTTKKDSLIIFEEDSVFSGYFNETSLLEEKEKAEETKGVEQKPLNEWFSKFKTAFNENYSFINSAMKMQSLIIRESKAIEKFLKNKTSEDFEEICTWLNNKYNLTDNNMKKEDFNALKAMVTYGKDYILSGWFYQCWAYSKLKGKELIEDAKFSTDEMKKFLNILDNRSNDESQYTSKMDFSHIEYTHPIFNGKADFDDTKQDLESNYKKLFFHFLVVFSKRWESSNFTNKEEKYIKNGFKSNTSYEFINEFIQQDLSK